MATLKKKMDLDEQLVNRVIELYPGISLTFLVEALLRSLIAQTEAIHFSLPAIIQKSTRDAKDEISLSSEI
jgi:hypothetical protein